MIRSLVPKGDCDRNKEGQTRRSRGRRQSSVDVPGNENGSNRHFGGLVSLFKIKRLEEVCGEGQSKVERSVARLAGREG